MYTNFYKLREIPFGLTPSPRFVYLGESHTKALDHLTHGVAERKGLILLTGEIGTGKTTMVKKLLSNLDTTIQYVYISNPLLSPSDFMEYLAFSAFKRKVHFKSHANFLSEFESFLRQCVENHKDFILVIDEAQSLSYGILDQIRVLSDMKLKGRNLLSIFLVGQTEFNKKLDDPRCRPIQHRIRSRYQIPPLDLEGTREYLTARLRIAGAKNGNSIFSKGAVEAIYEYSGGYPRMINSLADNVLLLGYSKGKKKITPLLVRQCHGDMNLDQPLSVITQSTLPAPRSKTKKRVQGGIRWKWAAVLLLFLLVGAVGTTGRVQKLLWNRMSSEEIRYQLPTDPSTKDPVLVRKRIEREARDPAPTHLAEQEPTPQVQTIQEDVEAIDIRQPEELREPSIPAERQEEKLSASIFVEEGSICRQVVDRRPVDVGNSFKAGVGKLYCFTKIVLSKPPPTEITHVWYFGRTEKARITLTIKSYHWRTYSSKEILPNEVGDWHVDVLGPEGEVLSIIEFRTTH